MILSTLEDTERLAQELATRLPHGALLLLSGPLGAGKTTLVSLLVRALQSTANVSSPTYTLVHEYPGPAGTIVHMDIYRLEDASVAAQQLGLDEYLEHSRLVVVEWGEGLLADYPEAWLVELDRSDSERRATIRPPQSGAGDG